MAIEAEAYGRINIVKYFVEERNITDAMKFALMMGAAVFGNLDCIKYLVEEAKVSLNHWPYIANARYFEHTDCLKYLRENGCPEPTDEQYAWFVENRQRDLEEENSGE